MRKVFLGLVLFGLVCSPFVVLGGTYGNTTYNGNKNVQRIQEKVIEYGPTVRVVAVPQNEVNAEYHWRAQQSTQSSLSEDDISRIVNAIVAVFEQRYGLKPVSPGDSAGQEPAKPDEVVAKMEALVLAKCASCHGVNDHGGQLDFVKDNKLALADLKKKLPSSTVAWMMYDAVFHERMPQGKPALTDEEVQVMQDYAEYVTKQERNAE